MNTPVTLVQKIDQNQAAYDSFALAYSDHFSSERFIREDEYLTNLVSHNIGQREIRTVLDLGCGDGLGSRMCDRILEEPYNYVGVDISEAMIGQAIKKQTGSNSHSRHTYVKKDAIKFIPEAEPADLILSFYGSPSYFGTNVEKVLRTVATKLSPTGVAILKFYHTPCGLKSGTHSIQLNGMSEAIPATCCRPSDIDGLKIPSYSINLETTAISIHHFSIARYEITNHLQQRSFDKLETVLTNYLSPFSRYTIVILDNLGWQRK